MLIIMWSEHCPTLDAFDSGFLFKFKLIDGCLVITWRFNQCSQMYASEKHNNFIHYKSQLITFNLWKTNRKKIPPSEHISTADRKRNYKRANTLFEFDPLEQFHCIAHGRIFNQTSQPYITVSVLFTFQLL